MRSPARRRHLAYGVPIAVSVLGCLCWGVLSMRTLVREHPVSRVPVPATVAKPPVVPPPMGWPCWGGPRGGHHYDGNLGWNAPPSTPVWRVIVGEGYSSPIIGGGRVLLQHRVGKTERIECWEVKTGQAHWRADFPATFECRVDYSSGPYSTPATDNEFVFAVGAAGELRALRLRDGELVWHRALINEFAGRHSMFPFGASPLLVGGVVIVPVGGGRANSGIIAFDKRDGREVWAATSDSRGYASPALATFHGKTAVCVLTHENVVVLEPTNGAVWWRETFRPKNPDVITATTPIQIDDSILVSAYQVGSACFQVLPNGARRTMWEAKRGLDSQHNNLVTGDYGVLGFSARDHSLWCIAPRSGECRWKWSSDAGRGSLVSAKDGVLLWGETGRLAWLRPDQRGCQCDWITNPLVDGPCYASPAVGDGFLVLRGAREMVAYQLP